MFYRFIKVQHKPINVQGRVQIQRSKETECALVWRTRLSGVPWDSVWCTRSIQGWTSHSRVSPDALRYNSTDCLVWQRSNDYFAQRSTTKARWSDEQWGTVRAESEPQVRGTPDTEQCMSGAAPDCPVPLEDKASNSQKLQNPSTATCPNGCLVVEGYKYPPNHHHPKHPRFLSITFITRALAFTPRHNWKDQSPSKSPIHLKHLVTWERERFCVLLRSCLLDCLLPFSFLFSSDL
jgi:hypothetical protein